VNLFTTYAPSRDSVPEGSRDLVIPVNPILYPAMSTLVRNIVVCRCRNNDSRRSDGKAAPLVIMNPGFTYESSEIEESIEKRMMSKMQGMRSWKETVDHSVLVAHDLPRGEVYQAFGMEWNGLSGWKRWLQRSKYFRCLTSSGWLQDRTL